MPLIFPSFYNFREDDYGWMLEIEGLSKEEIFDSVTHIFLYHHYSASQYLKKAKKGMRFLLKNFSEDFINSEFLSDGLRVSDFRKKDVKAGAIVDHVCPTIRDMYNNFVAHTVESILWDKNITFCIDEYSGFDYQIDGKNFMSPDGSFVFRYYDSYAALLEDLSLPKIEETIA